MSFIDLDKLDTRGLITHYVIECRNSGFMLPYDDHEIINTWIGLLPDSEKLLLILSEVLPPFFQSPTGNKTTRTLRGVHRKVLRRIKETAMRTEPV